LRRLRTKVDTVGYMLYHNSRFESGKRKVTEPMTATNNENEIKRPTSPQASVSARVPTQLKNKSNDVDELVELRRRYENTFAEAALACRQKNS